MRRSLPERPGLRGRGLRLAATEPLNPATGVDQLLLAGVERMALRADLDVELGLRGAGQELVTARAADMCDHVLGVDIGFHTFIVAAGSWPPGPRRRRPPGRPDA